MPSNSERPAARHGPSPRSALIALALSTLLLSAGAGWIFWGARSASPRGATSLVKSALRAASPWKNTVPGIKYVGDAACARCHQEIADTFRRHPMGRSLAPIATAPAVGMPKTDGSASFTAGGLQLAVERKGGRERHRETFFDDQGAPLARVENEVMYALGSGTRGISYLVEHDGRLFQSPISWYSQKNRWDLSPGYELKNLHFDRPIEPLCLFCHSNRVEPIPHTVNRYTEPIFAGHSIGCERCHGPGELHIRRPVDGDEPDLTIVNPRHLTPALRLAVCEQCHVVGDQTVERLGHALADFRPGLPSIDFRAVFGACVEGSKVVGHVEQMKSSRCFRASDGLLDCTSCHDPHRVPDASERIAYFRDRCLACHESRGCSVPVATRRATSREDSCIDCHMQKSASIDVVHVATTDHRVLKSKQAVKGSVVQPPGALPLTLLNGDGETERVPGSLGRELAIALALEGPRLPNTPQTRELGGNLLSLLDRATTANPDDLLAIRMKAQVLTLSGRRRDALPIVESLLKSHPDDEKTLDQYLAYAIDLGETQNALGYAEHAVALNPWSSAFKERCAHIFMEHKEWDRALLAARSALEINPFLRFARMFTVECLLRIGDSGAAQKEFVTLIKLHPDRKAALELWLADLERSLASPGR